MKQTQNIIKYFAEHVITVIALVMVWRGVWYILDGIDYWLFGGYGAWTGVLGLLVGIAILYIPDKKLKEIEKL